MFNNPDILFPVISAMDNDKLRKKICFAAAQLLNARQETDFTRAKWRAARSITRSYINPESVPTDMEIRTALQHLVSRAVPVGQSTPASSVSAGDEDDDVLPADRFDRYHALLEPLDRVRLNRDTHPEGDLLYHSLQVFELARAAQPWDEDFLTAALLHEVGRGIDPFAAHEATLHAIEDIVSVRSFWFVENLPTQHRLYDGTIGVRARRRLSQHEDGEALRLLTRCDSEGRVPGRKVCTLPEAIATIRELAWE